mgnify:CR=1 FL=1
MQNQNRKTSKIGNIIPFSPRKSVSQNVSVSTIATVIAVTILHNNDENPEDRLIELIESSGEVEILDALDATDDLKIIDPEQKELHIKPLNDN